MRIKKHVFIVEHMSGRLVQRWAPRMKPVTRFCSGIPGIRGLYYRTLADAAGLYDPNRFNARMFRNVIEAATRAPRPVEHIAVITGGRAYGVHLGPYFFPQWRLPLAEDSPRAPGPNWYFEIEDLLRTARKTSSWTYSIHRPHFILGITESSPLSLVNAVALYATLLCARGLPLIFPGGPLMYQTRLEAVDAELIGEQMIWAAGDARLADQDYNITNGKAFRWSEVWPDIAAYFGMEYEVSPIAKQVEEILGDMTEHWALLCREHGLSQPDLARVFPANFLNQSMMGFWDVEYDLSKVRSAGFTTTRGHFETFQRLFDRMVSRRYIPSPKG